MIYTVRYSLVGQQTFEGIQALAGLNSEKMPLEAKFLAQVWVEGETEYWWLENNGLALEELQRYYRMQYEREFSVRLFTQVTEARGDGRPVG